MAATTLKADGTLIGKRLAALVGLRDRARRVLQSQNEGWPEAHRTARPPRTELAPMTASSASYGPINKTTFGETADGTVIRRMPNLVKFREDPDAMLVMSLEDYDEVTGKATKAAIMNKDVVGKTPPITQVTQRRGRIAGLPQPTRRGRSAVYRHLYGKPATEVIAELGDLIFPDPEAKKWETADDYLSGNVRAKLAAAEAAGPPYARNADGPARTCSPRTCCPATSTPISERRGYRKATSRHSPPNCSASIRPRSRRASEERRRVEPRAGLRRQGVGGSHVRVRHAASQRHLAAWIWPST